MVGEGLFLWDNLNDSRRGSFILMITGTGLFQHFLCNCPPMFNFYYRMNRKDVVRLKWVQWISFKNTIHA